MPRRGYLAVIGGVLVLLGGLVVSDASGGAARRAGPAGRTAPPAEISADARQVGAYFFYWYLYPDPVRPANDYMAFQPPGLLPFDSSRDCFHAEPYCLDYIPGTYSGAYYHPNAGADPQRWWAWQFREMAEAGLDIAFFNSWDQESLVGDRYFSQELEVVRIGEIAGYVNGALDVLGDPVQVALFDDTTSEHHQWCVDRYAGAAEEECINFPSVEQYKMPLDGTVGGRANLYYFWTKVASFYQAIDRDRWATHNGQPVEAGGRPLILIYTPEPWFRHLSVDYPTEPGDPLYAYCPPENPCHYAVALMYDLRVRFEAAFGVTPFIVPNFVWWLSEEFDAVPGRNDFETHPDAVDGWSEFALGGWHLNDPGAVVHPWYNGYTTAYLAPGADTRAYSGPYGPAQEPLPSPPPLTPGPTPTGSPSPLPPQPPDNAYWARWWDPWGTEQVGNLYDHYYWAGWQEIIHETQGAVDLVVVESWNELFEGTAVCKLSTYISPRIEACLPVTPVPPTPSCAPVVFQEMAPGATPPAGGALGTPWYWMLDTRDLGRQWKGDQPPTPIVIDNDNACPGQGGLFTTAGAWQTAPRPHNYCETDAAYAALPPATARAYWQPAAGDAANYAVYAWWPGDTLPVHDVRYGVHYAGDGWDRYAAPVDQQWPYDAGAWNFLGVFALDPQAGDAVFLTNEAEIRGTPTPGADYHVYADAVKLVYHGPYTPPPTPTLTPTPTPTSPAASWSHVYFLVVLKHVAAELPTPSPPPTPSPMPEGGHPPSPPTTAPGSSPTPPVTPTPTSPAGGWWIGTRPIIADLRHSGRGMASY